MSSSPELTRICRVSNKPFVITIAEQEHLNRLSQLYTQDWFSIPLPTLHPLEEVRRVFAFTNYMNLTREKSELSARPQISRYPAQTPESLAAASGTKYPVSTHPGTKHPVSNHPGTKICTTDEFWSEHVDNTEVGRPYDFSRSFFEQWLELYRDSYPLPLNIFNSEDSEFVNGAMGVKSCYLCFNALSSRDCLHCFSILDSNDLVACVGMTRSELCYRCLDCEYCYDCQECRDCKNCSGCFGSADLIGCQDCFGCFGLRNVRHHVFNKPMKEAEYKAFVESQQLDRAAPRADALARCVELFESSGHEVNRILSTEGSSGDYLKNCRNCYSCFISTECEDCGYLVTSQKSKDCWRGFALRAELSGRSMIAGGFGNVASYVCSDCSYMFHSFGCVTNCSHCFGCVALKGKSYCILNKEYSKEEYLELLPRIIAAMTARGEWGEFFPPEIAPYPYSSTASFDLFPPVPHEVLASRGYRMDEPTADAATTGTYAAPPDSFGANDDELLTKTFACADTGQPFRYQRKELDFYLRNRVAPPERSWKSQIHSLLRKRKPLPSF